MILARITFGKAGRNKPSDLEDLVLSYLAATLHNGQICGEYFHAWNKGTLGAYVRLANPAALAARYHSKWSLKYLKSLIRVFGQKPDCVILEDAPRSKPAVCPKAPVLYLFTHAFDDSAPPISRGDTGVPVPSYLLPLSYEEREQLYFWQCSYRRHDQIWLGSGALEIPAYRQMADPASELSERGRDLCRAIQKETGIATFYYLMRYWGRSKGEDARMCPGCGRRWSTNYDGDHLPFWHFHFKCDKCKLVSHRGVSTDGGRHTRIGEYPGAKKNSE